MCNLAGYTGNKQAAPILIEMMKRQEFMDGGLSTGIATIHEGKLYTAKVLGDVEELLRTTDAANFPGTCGIMHSRPVGDKLSSAHPFLSEDADCAVIFNGTGRGTGSNPELYQLTNELMQKFEDRGCLRSAYPSSKPRLKSGCTFRTAELYAMLIGEEIKENGATKENMAKAMFNALNTRPIDLVMLSVHAALPGVITIGDITRPMCAGVYGDETYLATTALAFPEDVPFNHVFSVPCASICQATPGSLQITGHQFTNVHVEQPSAKSFAIFYNRIEEILKGQKDDPKSLYDFPAYTKWRDAWNEPLVDSKYAVEGQMLKPGLSYQVLWSFYKEGRLHSTIGEYKGRRITKFWID